MVLIIETPETALYGPPLECKPAAACSWLSSASKQATVSNNALVERSSRGSRDSPIMCKLTGAELVCSNRQCASWRVRSNRGVTDESPLEQCSGLSGDLVVRAEKGVWSRAPLLPPPTPHDDMQLVVPVAHTNKNGLVFPVEGWWEGQGVGWGYVGRRGWRGEERQGRRRGGQEGG